jgi:hypothetical protein
VQSVVTGQFWVKARGHQSVLSGHNDSFVDFAEDVHIRADALNDRGANEYRMEWILEAGDLEVGFKAVHLPPEGVSNHGHLKQAQAGLTRVLAARVEHARGEHDRSGAGSPDRTTIRVKFFERQIKFVDLHQLANRGAFTTRKDHTLKPDQVLWQPNLLHVATNSLQCLPVFSEIALKGQYAYVFHDPTLTEFDRDA